MERDGLVVDMNHFDTGMGSIRSSWKNIAFEIESTIYGGPGLNYILNT